MPRTRGRSHAQVADVWRDAASKPARFTKLASPEAAYELVESWPEGARGFATVAWSPRTGHIFSVENVGGRAQWIDAQTGRLDASDHLRRAMPGSIQIMRVDDLRAGRDIIKYVKNRGNP